MEIIDYVWSDGFVHHILSNSWWIPFELYLLFLLWSFLINLFNIKKDNMIKKIFISY